ncbi:MAG TPA: hypothetical protein VGX25_04875 [Actinophytocola sp.]|uniref:hypothetical protein n=1 Tax=Actinophytocola sp. TaxID=1872138 RepID=UPI002DDD7218|nr:hypothetical protein [Actinophytocola sp.]HEV2778715.1 hypothetical protein [Actinophytocola sp.]
MNRDRGWRPVGDGGWQHTFADRDAYTAGHDQYIYQHHYYGGAPARRGPMPTSVGVVIGLYVVLGWIGILVSGALTLLSIEGIASAAAGRPAVLDNVMISLIEAFGKRPSEADSRATVAVVVGGLAAALIQALVIQWMFRMARGLRRGNAECHAKVLNCTYFEVFFYGGLITVGFAFAVPVLTVVGVVLIISPVVIITALNLRSAHDWFDN